MSDQSCKTGSPERFPTRQKKFSGNPSPFRLLYSVRSPEAVIYRDELAGLERVSPKLDVDYVYTRAAPVEWPLPPKRLDAETLLARILPVDVSPEVFICGQTVFVETVADWLVHAGYAPESVKTERYGGTGGTS